ncbi:MAG: inositol monophosphatase family protein [Chloroflexota bacterium]
MTIDPILQAVRHAITLCREVQTNSLRSMNKINAELQDSEPVTIADYGSQVLICRALAEYFPDDGVIAEEGGSQFLELTNDKQKAEIINLLTTILDVNITQGKIVSWLDQGLDVDSSRKWIIDPIDGTKGFINMRHYAIGVGYTENGETTGAIIAAPGYGDGVSGNDDYNGAIFYIEDGKPYQVSIGEETDPVEMSVSDRSENLRVVQSYEKQHASKSRMSIVREKAGMSDAEVIELDSMEKYALVANGDADVYLRLPNLSSTRPHMVWDHAPGVALVLAAGGKATDVNGEPLDFSQGKTLPNRGMVISNGVVHDRLLEAVQELLDEEASAE